MDKHVSANSARKAATLRTEQQQETRERLVKATLDTIASKGYQRATIDNITLEARTGRATFYLHFNSKSEALLAGWQDIYMPQMMRLFIELDALQPPSDTFVAEWVANLMSFWSQRKAIALASKEAIALDAELAKRWFQNIWSVGQVLPNWAERNWDDHEKAKARLFMLFVYTEHALFMWLSGASPIGEQQVRECLIDQWKAEFGVSSVMA
jgi:AcrR family transcriptional regulator